jgi:hypothetical protein
MFGDRYFGPRYFGNIWFPYANAIVGRMVLKRRVVTSARRPPEMPAAEPNKPAPVPDKRVPVRPEIFDIIRNRSN